jgi:hypothetical protein
MYIVMYKGTERVNDKYIQLTVLNVIPIMTYNCLHSLLKDGAAKKNSIHQKYFTIFKKKNLY